MLKTAIQFMLCRLFTTS